MIRFDELRAWAEGWIPSVDALQQTPDPEMRLQQGQSILYQSLALRPGLLEECLLYGVERRQVELATLLVDLQSLISEIQPSREETVARFTPTSSLSEVVWETAEADASAVSAWCAEVDAWKERFDRWLQDFLRLRSASALRDLSPFAAKQVEQVERLWQNYLRQSLFDTLLDTKKVGGLQALAQLSGQTTPSFPLDDTAITLSLASPTAPREETKRGSVWIENTDTLEVGTTAPTVRSFLTTSEINLRAAAPPTIPAFPGFLLFVGEAEGVKEGEAEIIEPATYLGGAPALGDHAHGYVASLAASDAWVGFPVKMTYRGNPWSLSPALRAAVQATEGVYDVVGYDGRASLAVPILKLEPPLPSGYTGTIPRTSWYVERLPRFFPHYIPDGLDVYPTFLERLEDEWDGTISLFDKETPYRADVKITGTFVGTFVAGERVYNTNPTAGERAGVVLYFDGTTLYLHAMSRPFTTLDTLEGYESGAQCTFVASAVTACSFPSRVSGHANLRAWTSLVLGDRLHLRGKSRTAGGTDATIDDGASGNGNLLTLVLGVGEHGLWSSGLWNGSLLVVDGVEVQIDEITSETTATLTTSHLLLNKEWVGVRPPLAALKVAASGPLAFAATLDVSAIAGSPNSGYEADTYYLLRTTRYSGFETRFFSEVGFTSGQASTRGRRRWASLRAELEGGGVLFGVETRRLGETSVALGGSIGATTLSVVVDAAIPVPATGCLFVTEEGDRYEVINEALGTWTLDVPLRTPLARVGIEEGVMVVSAENAEDSLVFGATALQSAVALPTNETIEATWQEATLIQRGETISQKRFQAKQGDTLQTRLASFVVEWADETRLRVSLPTSYEGEEVLWIGQGELQMNDVLSFIDTLSELPLLRDLEALRDGTWDSLYAASVEAGLREWEGILLAWQAAWPTSFAPFDAVDRVRKWLLDEGWDRLWDTLAAGRIEEGLSMGYNEVSYSRHTQSLLSDVAGQLSEGAGEEAVEPMFTDVEALDETR